MSAPRPVYFNGKFYAGRLNGVHRVADRLIRECDARLMERSPAERPHAVLLAPQFSTWLPELRAIRIETSERTGQLWEQFILPNRAADGVLVNLANLAPVAHRRKITVIHDVQFLLADCGYPLRQKLGYRLLAPHIARTSSPVVTVSEYSRRMLHRHGIARPERVEVIPNGADHILEVEPDTRPRQELGLSPGSYVVMFGSAKPYKNNAVVFEAFGDRALRPTRLVVVGPSRAELERAGLFPPEDALFPGAIGDPALRGLLAGALAIAFPSRTEGFGLPPLEAMLCGCPVIASPAGAIPEACGDAAVYADVDDPRAWRDAILAMRGDCAQRSGRIEAGHRRASGFTWRASGSRLFGLLDRLAAT